MIRIKKDDYEALKKKFNQQAEDYNKVQNLKANSPSDFEV